MLKVTSVQANQNAYKTSFKNSNNISSTSGNNNSAYSPEEKKMIKRSALLGGAFYGCLGTGGVMLWNQFSKNKEPDMPAMRLKPKEEAIITIIGGLFVAAVGATVNSIQTKQAINLMHNMNNIQNNQTN